MTLDLLNPSRTAYLSHTQQQLSNPIGSTHRAYLDFS